MNKLPLFLAFASFALIACSDDKEPPLHSDICRKTPASKECLVSKWILDEVEGIEGCKSNSNVRAMLWLKADGEFSFENGSVVLNGKEISTEAYGKWKLTETGGIEITCTSGDCTKTDVPFNVSVEFEGSKLRITNSDYPSFLGHCKELGLTFTEVFSWSSKD